MKRCKSADLLFQQKTIKQLLIDKGKAFKTTDKGQTCLGICFVEKTNPGSGVSRRRQNSVSLSRSKSTQFLAHAEEPPEPSPTKPTKRACNNGHKAETQTATAMKSTRSEKHQPKAPQAWQCAYVCLDLLCEPVKLPCCGRHACLGCVRGMKDKGDDRCPTGTCRQGRISTKLRLREQGATVPLFISYWFLCAAGPMPERKNCSSVASGSGNTRRKPFISPFPRVYERRTWRPHGANTKLRGRLNTHSIYI